MYEITIVSGREGIFLKHNSRVYSGAIASLSPAFSVAGLARVTTSSGRFIAYGWYDEKAWTVLHLLSWNESIIPSDAWLKRTVEMAVERRSTIKGTDALRLVHGDADFIPGLAVDRYGSSLRAIVSSRYANDNMGTIAQALLEATGASILEVRTDSAFARLEKLDMGIRHFTRGGEILASQSSEPIRFHESGIWYEIENSIGQKSGFYCDQRDNRNIVEAYANGRKVLDACSFTGSFSLHCLRGGAESILASDSSETVLRHFLYQVHLNEDKGAIPEGSRQRVRIQKADVFTLLREIEEDEFDMIILDPPKLAPVKKAEKNAMTGYKDLNRLAMEKIADGGILATFSCSGAISREDFRTAIAWAAADAGVDIQILHQLGASSDHPVRVSDPETEYLKGLVLRVVK